MFEALRWRNAQHNAEAAIQHAARSLAQAGKAPIVIGSLAAMALLGMVTGMGLNHKGRGRPRAKIMPARVRNAAEDAMSAPRNGRRRRKRKAKSPAH
jgi:hypothetical protein